MNENVVEIKSEYEFAVKKAVIDFVLGGSLKESYNITENSTEERRGLKEAGTKFKHKSVTRIEMMMCCSCVVKTQH